MGQEDLLPRERAIFPGALCRRVGGTAWHTVVPVGMLSVPVPEAVGDLGCSPSASAWEASWGNGEVRSRAGGLSVQHVERKSKSREGMGYALRRLLEGLF